MSIYFNHDYQSEIFSNHEIKGCNQPIYKIDYLSQILSEQKKSAEDLHENIQKLKKHLKRNDWLKSNQLSQLESSIHEVREQNTKQNVYTSEQLKFIHQQVKDLEEHLFKSLEENEYQIREMKNSLQLLEAEQWKREQFEEMISRSIQSMKVELQEKLDLLLQQQRWNHVENNLERLTSEVKQVNHHLENQSLSQAGILERVSEIKNTQATLVQKAVEQRELYEDINNRFKQQEAISDKTMRQIDNLRSILYERTNFLAEKISDGMQVILQFLLGRKALNEREDQENLENQVKEIN